MECAINETLTQALYRLPAFTDALMNMLSPSDCAALMIAADYKPSQVYREKILSIRRELEVAGVDVSRRLEKDGIVLVGSDINKLRLRIYNPIQFWKCRTEVENMYICVTSKAFWKDYTFCCNANIGNVHLGNGFAKSAGWINIHPDSSSPLKILQSRYEHNTQQAHYLSRSEFEERYCNLETVFGEFKLLSDMGTLHTPGTWRPSCNALLSGNITVLEILKTGLTITEIRLHGITIDAFCLRCETEGESKEIPSFSALPWSISLNIFTRRPRSITPS